MSQVCCERKSPALKRKVKTPRLAVVGTVAIDSVKTPFGVRDKVFGGSASYFSYAASFFSNLAVVAVVGEDFPKEYRKVLEERKIDLSHLEVRPGKTFFWKGEYHGDLNTAHTLDTQLNVLLDFNPMLRFESTPPFVFLANVDPMLQLNVLKSLDRKKVKLTACDTMNFWIQNKRALLLEVIKRSDCFVLNEGEARMLTGEHNLIKAGRKLLTMGPAYLLIKKGEHGVLVLHQDQIFALPAFPVDRVIDPTGAGDSFAGGFMGSIAAHRSQIDFNCLKKAAAVGTIVASFTVGDFGLEGLRRMTKTLLRKRLDLLKKISKF